MITNVDKKLKIAVPAIQSVSVDHYTVSNSSAADPMDCGPSDSSVPGISHAKILEWVAIFSSGVSSLLRDQTSISCIGRQGVYH